MVYTNYYIEKGLLSQDLHWFADHLCLETIVGSQMYGAQNKDSDLDFLAIVMPQHQHLYPQNYGYVLGFDQFPKWERSERKGDKHKVLINDIETEGEWISLINFFYDAGIKGSPNLIEVLFAKRNLVTSSNDVGWMLRDNRHKFLSMKIFHSFKGYCFQQLQRVKRGFASGKSDNPKRQFMMDEWGYDVKMASHSLRLMDQIDQILVTGDIDLMRNNNEVKAMKSGQWGTFEEFEKYVLNRLKQLEEVSIQTKIPDRPAKESLKKLLDEIIEQYYGSESEAQKQGTDYVSAAMVWEKLDAIDRKLDTNG